MCERSFLQYLRQLQNKQNDDELSARIFKISGLGEAVFTSLSCYAETEKNLQLVQDLMQHLEIADVEPPKAAAQASSDSVARLLEGKKLVFTGKINGFSREQLQELCRLLGNVPCPYVIEVCLP